jgi:hypothetical protein
VRGAGFLTESYRNELCMERIGRRKICLRYWSPTMTAGNELHELQVVATRLAELQRADILIYSGELTRPGDGNVALGRRNRSKRPNCLLILRTLETRPKTPRLEIWWGRTAFEPPLRSPICLLKAERRIKVG